jgi:hypothetical protein
MSADLKILLQMMEVAERASIAGYHDLAAQICRDVIGYLTEQVEG